MHLIWPLTKNSRVTSREDIYLKTLLFLLFKLPGNETKQLFETGNGTNIFAVCELFSVRLEVQQLVSLQFFSLLVAVNVLGLGGGGHCFCSLFYCALKGYHGKTLRELLLDPFRLIR